MTRPEVRLIITPGVARVNVAYLAYSSPDVACIEIDMHTKRAVVGGAECGDVPVVCIGADEETLHKNPRKTDDTRVSFPDYPGWDVFLAECTRYTCRVALVRPGES